MAWNFDNIFHYNTPHPTRDMAFDGRDVWVISGTSSTLARLSILGYWDINSQYEGIYDGYFPDFYNTLQNSSDEPILYEYADIDLAPYLSGSEFVAQIVKVYDKMYISVVVNFDNPNVPISVDRNRLVKFLVFDIPTKSYDSTVNVTVTNARSGIGYQNNKIWFTDFAQLGDDPLDRQKLYYYDTINDTFSSGVNIPGPKQFTQRKIVTGNQGNVIVSNQNNNSILKFDDTNGAFVSEHIINRDPTGFYVRGDGTILIGSADGMMTTFDQSANTATNEDYATTSLPEDVADDGTYIWSIIPGLTRTLKSTTTDNFRFVSSNGDDYNINETLDDNNSFKQVSFKKMFLTPSITYQYWDGTNIVDRTVRPYLFLLSNNYVQAVRTQALFRRNIIRVRCNAMIGTGPEKYYGETFE